MHIYTDKRTGATFIVGKVIDVYRPVKAKKETCASNAKKGRLLADQIPH